jgi:hypothetical protein
MKVMNMQHVKVNRYGFVGFLLALLVAGGALVTVRAQDQTTPAPAPKKVKIESGRDPFGKPKVAAVVVKKVVGPITPPSIEDRIAQYRAQKIAAMNAHVPAPKPTSAFLLSEVQVIGISRTPRGYAAIVEATPIKMSYVVYPGERFYDAQLVAVEDSRLVFRHEIVWTDGRREQTVERKALRQITAVEAMSVVKTAPADNEKKPEEKVPTPANPK